MPFSVGGAVNSAADWLCGSPMIKGIMSNPIFTALLITSIAVVIILGLYYKEVKRRGWKRILKASIYVLLIVTAVCFVHHYAVSRCAREIATQRGVRDVFQGISQSQQAGSLGRAYPVTIEGAGETGRSEGAPSEGEAASEEQAGDNQNPPRAAGPSGAQGRPDNVADDGTLVIEEVRVGPGLGRVPDRGRAAAAAKPERAPRK